MILKNQWVNNNRRNQRISEDKWQWKYNLTKSTECSKSRSKREVHSNIGLLQETRKISSKLPSLPTKIIQNRRTNKTQIQQKEKIIKIREEKNYIETRKK